VPAMPIHHVDLAVTDVERSLAFYRALLDPLGWTRSSDSRRTVERRKSCICTNRRPARDLGYDRPTTVSTATTPSESSTLRSRSTSGTRSMPRTRDASRRGANIHFPPEEDRDIEGYYAFFVFDPDGIRVEVLWWPRDETDD
jgi:glyoxylase I family protein